MLQKKKKKTFLELRILAFWQIHDKLIHFPPLIPDTIILIPSIFIVHWAHYCNTEIVMQ